MVPSPDLTPPPAAAAVATQAAAQALVDEHAQAAAAEAARQADVRAHPGKYLLVLNPTSTTTGLIRHETQLTSMTVENVSPYMLTGVTDEVLWRDETGAPSGTTTQIMLAGPVSAGATVTVSTADGTIASSGKIGGKGTPSAVHVTRAAPWTAGQVAGNPGHAPFAP